MRCSALASRALPEMLTKRVDVGPDLCNGGAKLILAAFEGVHPTFELEACLDVDPPSASVLSVLKIVRHHISILLRDASLLTISREGQQ